MSKRYRKKDPHAAREAERYEQPIPSREFIQQYLEDAGKPMGFKALLGAFGLEEPSMLDALKRRLRAMEREGQLMSNRRNQYALVEELGLVHGRVLGRKDGHGFVKPDEGGDDIYLSPAQMRRVFPNDEVLVSVSGVDRRGRPEGTIVEVVAHNTSQVVGRYNLHNSMSFVEPEHKNITQDVLIPKDKRGKAKDGQYVVAKIVIAAKLLLLRTSFHST